MSGMTVVDFVQQRIAQNGSTNVTLRDLELGWRNRIDRDATLAEDFILWCKRSGWRATVRDGVVEVRR